METIYGKVKPGGLSLPLEVCGLANLKVGDDAIINVRHGEIEIHATRVSGRDSQKIVNKHLIRKLGDALISGEPELAVRQGKKVWRVPVILSYTGKTIGEIFVNSETGDIIDELSASGEELKRKADVEYNELDRV
jgi:hypothetical protein